MNEVIFDSYDFVAHIRIEEVAAINGPHAIFPAFNDPETIVSFSILTLYRGARKEVAYELDRTSSCGTFYQAGEEYIVSARTGKDGIPRLHSCTLSSIYRNHKGARVLEYSYPSRLKGWLDSLCQLTPSTLALSGPDTIRQYFPDGTLAESTAYFNGQPHGPSRYYYANGTLMDERYFRHGTATGARQYFREDGTLAYRLTYNDAGQVIHELTMPDSFRERRCETDYVAGTEVKTTTCYWKNGRRYSKIKQDNYDIQEARYYSRKGDLIHHVQHHGWDQETVLLDSLAN